MLLLYKKNVLRYKICDQGTKIQKFWSKCKNATEIWEIWLFEKYEHGMNNVTRIWRMQSKYNKDDQSTKI